MILNNKLSNLADLHMSDISLQMPEQINVNNICPVLGHYLSYYISYVVCMDI